MFAAFLTNNGHFTVTDPNYRRVYLINSMLLGIALICSIFFVINLAFFQLYSVALVDFIGALCAVLVWRRFQQQPEVDSSAWQTVILLALVLLAYLAVTAAEFYSLSWAMVFPPVAFFLLGRQKGLILTVAFFVLAWLLLRLVKVSLPVEAWFNIGVSSICLVFLIRYFEVSRNEAFKALAREHRKSQQLSITDSLTGIYNRAKLDALLESEINRAVRHHSRFSVILCDLDFFKRVNDQFGHMVGDQVLIQFAAILTESCRDLDIAGRWGGEEFLVLCPHTNLAGAVQLAERIRSSVENARFEHQQRITLSLGIAELSANEDSSSLLKRADDALYRAKAKGRNRAEY
ncbi:GGDEF domain-containing protein [Arsukibacterium sp.]|uniref:GGDEF domain-containing protein n=1 Tax=Arsukibacterium sp. TaxID=1977258 RepID=UPI002FD9F085